VYSQYFTAAAHFLTGRDILPEIRGQKACEEEDLARSEALTSCQIPAELRAYYREIGDWFMFIPDLGQTGFAVSAHNEVCWESSSFAKTLLEDAEQAIQSKRPEYEPEFLRAEVERRFHWFPFYNIGGGGYLLCLDTTRDPSPVYYHEEGYWCGRAQSSRTFELAPSFTEFIRQWSRFCFSDPGCSIINFCMDRHGAFDWSPRHFDTKYDRGSIDG
jgi:hypothetical protein